MSLCLTGTVEPLLNRDPNLPRQKVLDCFTEPGGGGNLQNEYIGTRRLRQDGHEG